MKNQDFMHFVSCLVNTLIKAGGNTVQTKYDFTVKYYSLKITLTHHIFHLKAFGSNNNVLACKDSDREDWPYYSVRIGGVEHTFDSDIVVPQAKIDNIAFQIDFLADKLFMKPNKNDVILDVVLDAAKEHQVKVTRETYLIKKSMIHLYKEQNFKNAQFKVAHNKKVAPIYKELLNLKNQLPHSLKLRFNPYLKIRKLPGTLNYYEVTFNNGKVDETFLNNIHPYCAIRKAEFGLREILTQSGHDFEMVKVLKSIPNLFKLNENVLKNLEPLSTIK